MDLENAVQCDRSRKVTETERVAALDRLNLMGSAEEERFDRITRTAKEIFGVQVAAVTLVGAERLFVKSPQNLSRSMIPREESICNVAIRSPEILLVPDARTDRRFAELPDVAGGKGVRFYAGRPLHLEPGMRAGTLCLYDTRPRVLTAEELIQFEELGAWAEAELLDSADRDRARFVQQAMLPSDSVGEYGYDFAGLCIPKGEIGGDFYSWWESGPYLCLAIADVMGKGTGAALLAATVRAAIHSTASLDPGETLDMASTLLAHDLETTSTFVTAFLATLNRTTGALHYTDAGHGLTMIVSPDGSYRRLRGFGLPLGIGEQGSWQEQSTELLPGDTLASFTDGVLDLYGGTLSALPELAVVISGSETSEVIKKLRELCAHTAPDDDLTAIIVRRIPGSESGTGCRDADSTLNQPNGVRR